MPRRIGQDIVAQHHLRWHRAEDRNVDVRGESFCRYQRWQLVIPETHAGHSVWDRSRRWWALHRPQWADVSVTRRVSHDRQAYWQVSWMFQPHDGRLRSGSEETRNLATVSEIVHRFQNEVMRRFQERYEWRPNAHMGLNAVSILDGTWHPDRHPARLRPAWTQRPYLNGGQWVHDVLWWEPTAPERTETPPAPRYEVQRVEVRHLGSGWWQEQRVRV